MRTRIPKTFEELRAVPIHDATRMEGGTIVPEVLSFTTRIPSTMATS